MHAITQKGHGYQPAERHDEDNFHSLGAFHSETGEVLAAAPTIWTDPFSQELIALVLHRAGVTGEDGASHHGMWDMSILQVVPRLRLAAPRDGNCVRELLSEAVEVSDAPTDLRIPKGAVPADLPALDRISGVDVLSRADEADVMIVAVGAMATTCLDVASRLRAQGIGVTVVDPRWVKPVNPCPSRART